MSHALKKLTLSLLVSSCLTSAACAEAMFIIQPDDLLVTGSVPAPKSQFMTLGGIDEPQDIGIQVPVFRRLAADPGQLRFDGEMGSQDLPVYIRPDQVTEPGKLKLRYLSAVSVMPEASRMSVSINGKPLAVIALDAATEAANTEIELPPGLLQPGYNAVRFTVQQRHRVDCTIEAANELWTKIDLAHSGFALTATHDQVSSADQLSGVLADETGAVPIYVIVPTGTAIPTIDLAVRAAQAVVLRSGFAKPRVTFVTEPGGQPGIHLYVGTSTELRNGTLPAINLTGANLFVEGRSSGIVRVVVSGDSAADVATTITRLASEGATKGDIGTPEGLQALKAQRGVKMTGDSDLTFTDLGLSTQEFNGRVFRTSFNIVLPPDFYPADNGKATLYLDGEYVGGLLTSNEALVSVNGKVSGASRLTRSGGETISRRPIAMTLRALHPGHNTITLEVRTGSEGDKECNPLSLIDASQRLRVDATSSFSLPSVARMEHLPNLGALVANGFPLGDAQNPLTLYMPRASHEALGAATTLLARAATATGQVIETQISRKVPDTATGAAIIVGPIGDIPDPMLAHFGIRKDILPKTWRNAALQKAAGVSAAPEQPVKVASLASGTASDVSRGGQKPQEPEKGSPPPTAADAAAAPPTVFQRASGALARFLERNVGFNSDQVAFLNGGRTATKPSAKTSVIMAQQHSLSGAESWLLLTGVDAATLQADTAALVAPANWHQIKGRMAAYDPTSAQVVSFTASSHYHHALKDKSIGNVTLVTAGWLSNNILYYVIVILALCGFFGIMSRKLLNRVGVRP